METQNTTTAQEPKPVRGQGVLEWYEALISAALVLVLVFSFFFRIIQVDGSSMVPTLVNGDKLIVWANRWSSGSSPKAATPSPSTTMPELWK